MTRPHDRALDALLTALDQAEASDGLPASDLTRDRAAFAARARQRRAAGPRWRRGAVAVVGLAAGGLLAVHAAPEPSAAAVADEVRAKGGVGVDAWRVGMGPSELLYHRDQIRAGDTVQLTVSAPEPRRVAVWSRDGSGQTVAWFGETGTVVAAGTQVVLDQSATFDDTLGAETIVARACAVDQAVGTDPWTAALVPSGCRTFRWQLEKQP